MILLDVKNMKCKEKNKKKKQERQCRQMEREHTPGQGGLAP